MKRQRFIVGYVRVSTARQKKRGWGLKSQIAELKQYARRHHARILRIYQEQESGDNAERPQLALAVAHARRSKARLVVAKLDRLVRSSGLLHELEKSGVQFVCCDYPHANKLTVHILAAVAEHELDLIRKRTKAGLRTARRSGQLLGAANPKCRNLTETAARRGRRLGAATIRQQAVEAYASLLPQIQEWRGTMTLQAIADRLNDSGETTQTGGEWSPTAVHRVLQRVG